MGRVRDEPGEIFTKQVRSRQPLLLEYGIEPNQTHPAQQCQKHAQQRQRARRTHQEGPAQIEPRQPRDRQRDTQDRAPLLYAQAQERRSHWSNGPNEIGQREHDGIGHQGVRDTDPWFQRARQPRPPREEAAAEHGKRMLPGEDDFFLREEPHREGKRRSRISTRTDKDHRDLVQGRLLQEQGLHQQAEIGDRDDQPQAAELGAGKRRYQRREHDNQEQRHDVSLRFFE